MIRQRRYTLVRQRSGRQSLRGRLVGQANKRVDVLGSSALIDTEAHERSGWEAVANSGIALTESARLLEIPRKCSSGNAAPIQGATWKKGLTRERRHRECVD
jgi:hypothetical protein